MAPEDLFDILHITPAFTQTQSPTVFQAAPYLAGGYWGFWELMPLPRALPTGFLGGKKGTQEEKGDAKRITAPKEHPWLTPRLFQRPENTGPATCPGSVCNETAGSG